MFVQGVLAPARIIYLGGGQVHSQSSGRAVVVGVQLGLISFFLSVLLYFFAMAAQVARCASEIVQSRSL